MQIATCCKCGKQAEIPDIHTLPQDWERSEGDDFCDDCMAEVMAGLRIYRLKEEYDALEQLAEQVYDININPDPYVLTQAMLDLRSAMVKLIRHMRQNVYEHQSMANYTRVDAGTGREVPLSDDDWPQN